MPARPTETDPHSRRVASLASEIARLLGLETQTREALQCASLEHHKFRLPFLRKTSAGTRGAGQILRLFAGAAESGEAPELQTAAAVLQLCEAFDQSIEFAVMEAQPLSRAIADFMADAEPWNETAFNALRFVIAPEPLVIGGALPVLPSAASALMRTNVDAVSAAELAAIAGDDPVLSANLLGIANSASHGRSVEVRTLRDAVLRVGIPLAHKALLAASLGRLFASSSLRKIWKHSSEAAAICHYFALEIGFDPDEAWLAGLLHDIGRLVFETSSARFCAREQDWIRGGFPPTYAALLVWGRDHASAGAELAQLWNLPKNLVDAIRYHTAPELDQSPLAALVYLADRASTTREETDPEDLAAEYRTSKALSATGLSAESMAMSSRQSPMFALAS